MFKIVGPPSTPIDAYLEYALSFTRKERKLVKEFNKWLPNEIIDAHVHSNTKSQCRFINDYYLSRVPSTFPWFEIIKHIKVNKTLYPEKNVKILVSPIPYQGIDHKAANDYIVRQAIRNSSVIPVVYGIPDDIEYTISQLKTQKFYGLKMYPKYFSPPARKISQYFPSRVLRYCEKENLPIILHLPEFLPECQKDLIAIAKRFPDLKIILAHMGLAHQKIKGLKKAFFQLIKYENIYLDTAMVSVTEVFEMALNILGYQRIIFGTDQPLNLIRGRMCTHPTLGRRLATTYPYHWADLKEQKKLSKYAADSVLFHWEMLLALQKAIQSYGENKDIRNSIFNKNAKRVFGL